MGIEVLEERYRRIAIEHASLTAYFADCANRASHIQREIRSLFDHITPHLCGACENKCCEGFPLEGWFSVEEYLLFRIKYGKPLVPPDRINRPSACSFLTPRGCSLPADLRPFTCVKINCAQITEALKDRGAEQQFNQLSAALDAVRKEVSGLIKGHTLSPALYPTDGSKAMHIFNTI